MGQRDSEESREKRFPIATAAESGCAKIQSDLNALTQATANVTAAFKCDWDDQIKESYRKYDNQCKQYTEEIGDQVKKFKEACEAIRDIDVGYLIEAVESCSKAVEDACRGC